MNETQILPPSLPPGGSLYLVVLAGPARAALELDPQRGGASGGLILGRHDACDLCLSDGDQVSRRHARLLYHDGGDAPVTTATAATTRWRGSPKPARATEAGGAGGAGGWRVADADSRWGTFLNGRRLEANVETPLRVGDQLRVTPWTFLVSASPTPRGMRVGGGSGDDDAAVHATPLDKAGPLQQERLALLLGGAAGLQEAADERDLAGRLMKLARDGTGLVNAAVLRPLDAGGAAGGRYDVLASTATEGVNFAFSRSLLEAARSGRVTEVRAGDSQVGGAATSQSIVQMSITRALCAPVLLGETPAMYLYLDQRGETAMGGAGGAGDEAGAVAFCAALSKIASLALSHLKRLDMERRAAALDADLRAAAAAQQWILPGRETTAAGFRVVGESRAGRGVGGDFFDLLDLGDGKLAVALGDVSGKGVAAGVLMTATQGYLNALLGGGSSPAASARRLTAFVHPRRPASRFVTLWVGLFDRAAGTLTYVDAGHGLAVLHRKGGDCTPLAAGGGLPIGILPDGDYDEQTVPFGDGDAVLVVSDGIVEQPADGNTFEDRDEFGLARAGEVLCRCLSGENDPVAAVFDAVVTHAGTEHLADDATAVLVRW